MKKVKISEGLRWAEKENGMIAFNPYNGLGIEMDENCKYIFQFFKDKTPDDDEVKEFANKRKIELKEIKDFISCLCELGIVYEITK